MESMSVQQLPDQSSKVPSNDSHLLPDLQTDALLKDIFSTSHGPSPAPNAFSTSLNLSSVPAPLLPTTQVNTEEIRSPISRSPGALDLGQLEAMADAQINWKTTTAPAQSNAVEATPMTCDSPVEVTPQVDTSTAQQSQKSPDNVSEAASILPAPAIGDRFESREQFKQTCQQYADSFSTANPACRFHFATRTSSADKWLVFSCSQHVKGCPVLVRVERDRLTHEWVITAHQYEHKHPHGSNSVSHTSAKLSEGASISRPSSSATNKSSRKFSVVRKREKEEASLDYQPYARPRSRNSIIIPETKRRHSVDGNARSGSIIRAIIKHKRSSDHLPIGNNSSLLTEEALLPHFASHGIQHAHSNERRGSVDSLRPPSPNGSNSSISSDLYSYRSRGLSISSAGSDQASSYASSLREPTGTLKEYLTAVHQLLGADEVVSCLKTAGIMDIATLLSLEQAELHCLVDTFADVTPLQKLLIKNRIARALK